MEQRPSWEADTFSAGQYFPRLLWNPKVITAFTAAPAICPCHEPDGSSRAPHPTSLTSTLILSSHLRLGLPSGLLTSAFPHTCAIALYLFVYEPRREPPGGKSRGLFSGIRLTAMRSTTGGGGAHTLVRCDTNVCDFFRTWCEFRDCTWCVLRRIKEGTLIGLVTRYV
jgi:hypothetical protein